jgi:phage gp29-like protein
MATVQNINSSRLLKPQSAPKVGSIISPHRAAIADTLSPQRLGRIMKSADEGDIEAYLTLAEEMEEREPHYSSVLQSRKLAVASTVPVVEMPDDSTASSEIATWVEERIVFTPQYEGLVLDLMDGVPKGFSCVEILWQRDDAEWWPSGYAFREQRHFVFDDDTMTVPMLRTDDGDPVALRPYSWLVHRPRFRSGIPARTGLARTIAVCYAAKRWTVADWLAFMDIYGIPFRIGRYPAHLKDMKTKLLRAVRALGSDAAAVIPKEMDVEIVESKNGAASGKLFQESAEYWDKQTSKVVLGQTMTTDDGSSLAQSKIHQDTKFEIRDADSRAIDATINRDLIRVAVDLNFGPQKVYPTVRTRQRKAEDIKLRMEATRVFVNMGGRVQASEARDALGYAEPEEGAELLLPEAVVQAKAAPPPPPVSAPADDDSKVGEKVDDDEDIEVDEKQLNRERLAARARRAQFDATDQLADEELDDWRALTSGNVGRLIREMQEAGSYAEARDKLEELRRDYGDVLDVEALVVSLARKTFQLRGLGDATDEVKP